MKEKAGVKVGFSRMWAFFYCCFHFILVLFAFGLSIVFACSDISNILFSILALNGNKTNLY